MNRCLRIAVADDEVDMRHYFESALPKLGHEVVAVARDGKELLEQCLALEPDLLITDIKMPEMDGIDAAEAIYRHRPVPVIIVSAHDDTELIDRAARKQVMAYLVKPIKNSDLKAAITLAMNRNEEFEALRKESASLRQALEDRKKIERAKGILMQRSNVSEPVAFKNLQKLARDRNKTLVEIADMIVTVEEAFGG